VPGLMEALNRREDESHGGTEKYPAELQERATHLAVVPRRAPATRVTSLKWCSRSEVLSSSAWCWRGRGHRVDVLRVPAVVHSEKGPAMALDQPALLELLEALKAADVMSASDRRPRRCIRR
jgi:hypothetical protein